VISHKNIFVFGELLEVTSVKSLKESEFTKDFNTLELFAYGTYRDYTENRELYLDLTELQAIKLKQLTILSLAAKQKVIPFSTLQSEVDIVAENQRSLEDLIIDTMYLGLLTGKLDQIHQILRVKSVAARDVKISELDDLINTLNSWKSKFGILMNNLQSSSGYIAEKRSSYVHEQNSLQYLVNAKRSSLKDAIDSGVDARDLEDFVTNRSGSNVIGDQRQQQQRSSNILGSSLKAAGKRLMSGMGGGFGGQPSSHRGPGDRYGKGGGSGGVGGGSNRIG